MGVIRLLLAMSVLLDHTRFEEAFGFFAIVGGPLAVQAFFIISGFYIGLILDTKYHDVALFWSNRCLRIFPTYWLIVGLTLVFVGLFDRAWFLQWTHLGWSAGLMIAASTVLLVAQDLWMFMGINGLGLYLTPHFQLSTPPLYIFLLIPQAWSLALELYFYMLAPWLVKLRTSWLLVCTVALLGGRFAFYRMTGLDGDPWSYRFFPFELAMFLLGIVAYRIYRIRRAAGHADVALYGTVVLLTALFPVWSGWLPSVAAAGWIALAILFAALPSTFLVTARNKVDRALGELSYPLYVCHILAAKLVAQLGLIRGAVLSTIATALLALLMATLILKYLDEPLSRLRQRRLLR